MVKIIEKLNITQKYLKIPLKILYIFGISPRKKYSQIYLIYSFSILFFTQYFYAFSQIIYMIKEWGDIEKIAEASFLLLTQATLCFKISNVLFKKEKIHFFTMWMNEDVFQPTRVVHLKIISESSSRQMVEYLTFNILASSTIAAWAVFPLIDAPNEKVLPLKAWYPLDNQLKYYELLYIYQIVGIWFSSLINGSVDKLANSMTAHGCAQIQILQDNLTNIEKYAFEDLDKIKSLEDYSKYNKSNENLDLNKVMKVSGSNIINSKNYKLNIDILIDQSLKKCIVHHQEIVRFIDEVEKCYHWGILAQFAASVGIICITGLQITLIKPTSMKFASKVIYLLVMLAQIYFICLNGNTISVKSSEVIASIYSSSWVERNKKFNKSLLIFMERLKQPIITRAGFLFPLSLQTFVSILRSSYSYFAVLKQLNSEK